MNNGLICSAMRQRVRAGACSGANGLIGELFMGRTMRHVPPSVGATANLAMYVRQRTDLKATAGEGSLASGVHPAAKTGKPMSNSLGKRGSRGFNKAMGVTDSETPGPTPDEATQVEIELKFIVPRDRLDALAADMRQGEVHVRRLLAIYYDTDDG
ncbi:MAG: hypothetical protein ABIV63_19365 [Caldimonas sp.]